MAGSAWVPASTHAITVSMGVAPVGGVMGTAEVVGFFDDVCGDEVGAAVSVCGGIGVSVGCPVGVDEHAETAVASTAAAVRATT